MERREGAGGLARAPLGGPCDRATRAPCEGARPLAKRAAPPGRSIRRHALSAHRALLDLSDATRDDALRDQDASNISAVERTRISFCAAPHKQKTPPASRRGFCATCQ